MAVNKLVHVCYVHTMVMACIMVVFILAPKTIHFIALAALANTVSLAESIWELQREHTPSKLKGLMLVTRYVTLGIIAVDICIVSILIALTAGR